MAITIVPTGTRIPKMRAHMVDVHSPVVALNCTNEYMDLSPAKGLGTGVAIAKAGELRSAYKVGLSWFYWTQDVDLIKSQITSNLNRFYFTAASGYSTPQSSREAWSNTGAESTWPSYSRPLGIAPPVDPVTLTEYGTEDTTKDAVVVSYVYTYVTSWDEESAPSEVSTVTTIPGGKYVSVRGIIDPNISYVNRVRIYRLESTEDGNADYTNIGVRMGSIAGSIAWNVFLSSVTGPNYELFDANSGTSPTGLGTAGTDIIPSEDWAEPPAAMHHLTQYLGGMLVGAFDNVLCVSEPLIPYAWPVSYRKTFEYDIVALGVYQSAVVVLTEAYPFVVQGQSPLGMVSQRIEQRVGCVSKRGTVSSRFGVIFPAEDGLYLVDGFSAKCVTDKLFTTAQWIALDPSKLIGFFLNDSYIGFFEGSDYVIEIDFSDGWSLYETNLGVNIYGGYIEALTNELWLLGKVGSTYKRYVWGGSVEDLEYTWQTKTFKTHPTNIEVMQVISPYDQGSISVTVLYDWEEGKPYPDLGGETYSFSDNNFRWLRGGKLCRSISFLVRGRSKIDMIKFAGSPEELNNE